MDLALSLFEREAVALEKLGNHHGQIPDLLAYFPLIVENPHTGKEDQFFYLVQEFINGQDLEKAIEHNGVFSEKEVRWVLREMLGILDYVHSTGTIHRDIKPSNLIRDQNGKLFLLDFGAVKQIASGVAAGKAGSSTGIYSMGFAPPEQMAGGQVYPSTDLYALAVTCLYLLTGKTADELYDAYHNQWNWRSPGLRVSDQLAGVLDKMLLPTPKNRYADTKAVMAALSPTPVASPGGTNTATQIQPSRPSPATPSSSPGLAKPRPPKQPGKISRLVSQLPVIKVLGQVGFTGFAGILLWIAAASLMPDPSLSWGLWGMVMGVLIFAQLNRWVEQVESLILVGIGLGAFWFLPGLSRLPLLVSLGDRLTLPVFFVIVGSAFAGAFAVIAVTALFILILKLLFAALGIVSKP